MFSYYRDSMSQELLVIHSLITAVSHLLLKTKIMITGEAEIAPGHLKEPGGTNRVTTPT